MSTSSPDRKSYKEFLQQVTEFGPGRSWLLAIVPPLAIVAALSWTAPGPLVLPALSVALFCIGLAIAASNCISGTRRDYLMDVAGALVFLGCAAAMLADTQQALATFDGLVLQLTEKPTTE